MDSGREHLFTFTPAMSLLVDFDSEPRLDAAFMGLSEGATVLMPLQAYPFSAKFGWLEDRYGVSWQLNLLGSGRGLALVPATAPNGAVPPRVRALAPNSAHNGHRPNGSPRVNPSRMRSVR